MNRKIILSLLSTPFVVTSLLSLGVMASKAQAVETDTNNTDTLSCVRNYHVLKLVCARSSDLAKIPAYQPDIEFSADNSDNGSPFLAFNTAESDMAVQLFQCDCPACINSLRQMRGVAPLVY